MIWEPIEISCMVKYSSSYIVLLSYECNLWQDLVSELLRNANKVKILIKLALLDNQGHKMVFEKDEQIIHYIQHADELLMHCL